MTNSVVHLFYSLYNIIKHSSNEVIRGIIFINSRSFGHCTIMKKKYRYFTFYQYRQVFKTQHKLDKIFLLEGNRAKRLLKRPTDDVILSYNQLYDEFNRQLQRQIVFIFAHKRASGRTTYTVLQHVFAMAQIININIINFLFQEFQTCLGVYFFQIFQQNIISFISFLFIPVIITFLLTVYFNKFRPKPFIFHFYRLFISRRNEIASTSRRNAHQNAVLPYDTTALHILQIIQPR